MTDLRTAAQQALEALESAEVDPHSSDAVYKAITALKAALPEPEEGGNLPPPLQKPGDFDHGIGADRFRVVRGAFWWHVLIGDSPTEHGKFRSRASAEKMAADLLREFRNGAFVQHEAALAEPVQEPVACEPQYANDDGWCDWVCPQPRGYLMQCCDCGLIHEVDSRVAKYQPRPSEEFEVVDDPDLQVQWRMKRRDDISPKRKPLTEDEIALIVADCSASAHRQDDFHFARAIERAHGIT